MQDTKLVLAELREAKFGAEELQESVTGLETELTAAVQQMAVAQQNNAELEEEVVVQGRQQQHLLDELSQSQVPVTAPFNACHIVYNRKRVHH